MRQTFSFLCCWGQNREPCTWYASAPPKLHPQLMNFVFGFGFGFETGSFCVGWLWAHLPPASASQVSAEPRDTYHRAQVRSSWDCFWCYWGLNSPSHLLALYVLVIFQVGFVQARLRPWSSCLCLPSNWDNMCMLSGILLVGCWLDGGLANFLLGLALYHSPPDLCLPSSWDYRHEPIHLENLCFLRKAFIVIPDWRYFVTK
jgi:hypothetical protein